MMKKLVTFGDSYMTPCLYDPDYPPSKSYIDKHFTELLSRKGKLELISYARGGVCNHTIYQQVRQFLYKEKIKPHHVIIGFTEPERILISDTPWTSDTTKDTVDLNYIQSYIKKSDARFFTSALNNIVEHQQKEMLEETLTPTLSTRVNDYVEVLPIVRDTQIAVSTSIALVTATLSLLHFHDIPFTYYCNFVDEFMHIPAFKDKGFGRNSRLNPWFGFSLKDPYVHHSPYHTSVERQQELASLYEPIVLHGASTHKTLI